MTSLILPPEIPADEKERSEELYRLHVLDAASDLRFDRYTSLVATIFDFPIVTVTFIDTELQWFKSSCGLDISQTSRDASFCAHTINEQDGIIVVPDTHRDPRFSGNPLVVGPPYVRFYAGAVVRGPDCHALGALCTIDRLPRDFSYHQCIQLRQFADLVENEINHHYDLATLRTSIQLYACYDPVTRLPNRHLLTICLGKLLDVATKTGGDVAVVILHLPDLYLLKQSLRSSTVEGMLVALADRLRTCCPTGGSAARLESDEFALAFASFDEALAEVEGVYL